MQVERKTNAGLGDRWGFKDGRVAIGGAESAHHAHAQHAPHCPHGRGVTTACMGAAARLARPGSLFPFSAASVQQSEPFPRAWRGCRNPVADAVPMSLADRTLESGPSRWIETKRGPGTGGHSAQSRYDHTSTGTGTYSKYGTVTYVVPYTTILRYW